MKYRKKPVIIEAEQFTPANLSKPWPAGVEQSDESSTGYRIHTLEGGPRGQEVTPGDFIITGVQGEKYPCKPDIFAATYEPVTAADEPQA